MKKLLSTILLMGLVSLLHAQEIPKIELKNSLKVGFAKGLAGGLDLEYEHKFKAQSSMGVNLYYGFDNYIVSQNISVVPYYRFYFNNPGKREFKGFFGQAFAGYYNGESSVYYYDYYNSYTTSYDENYNSMGLGFALGYKLVSSNGFTIQPTLGAARRLFGTAYTDVLFQGDLYIGYTF